VIQRRHVEAVANGRAPHRRVDDRSVILVEEAVVVPGRFHWFSIGPASSSSPLPATIALRLKRIMAALRASRSESPQHALPIRFSRLSPNHLRLMSWRIVLAFAFRIQKEPRLHLEHVSSCHHGARRSRPVFAGRSDDRRRNRAAIFAQGIARASGLYSATGDDRPVYVGIIALDRVAHAQPHGLELHGW